MITLLLIVAAALLAVVVVALVARGRRSYPTMAQRQRRLDRALDDLEERTR